MAIEKMKRKKGVVYRASVRDASKKKKSKTFRRKADAEAWVREQLLLREQPQDPERVELLFEELTEQWWSHRVSKRSGSTQERYEQQLRLHINPTFDGMLLHEIAPKDVDDWFRKLQLDDDVKLGNKSLNGVLVTLKSIFNWAVKTHRMIRTPASAVESLPTDERKGYDFWLTSEVRQFLTATREHHFYAFFVTALNTGMRLNELVGLQKDAVDLHRGLIRVGRTWCPKEKRLKETTKSKKPRMISINAALRPILAEQMMRSPGEWVFSTLEGHRICSQRFTQQVFRPLCRRAGVREIRFHDLRHTFASHFVMNGGDLRVLQELLGHSTITITELYAHLAPDYLQGATDVLSFGVASQEPGQLICINGGRSS